jgi:hypothetical protein
MDNLDSNNNWQQQALNVYFFDMKKKIVEIVKRILSITTLVMALFGSIQLFLCDIWFGRYEQKYSECRPQCYNLHKKLPIHIIESHGY